MKTLLRGLAVGVAAIVLLALGLWLWSRGLARDDGGAGRPVQTVDCLFDEAVLPTLDAKGWFTVVVSRAPDRPRNATEAGGVAWMEWGNGDGVPGGSADYGSIINRHTHVDRAFAHSWFAVRKPGSEAAAMADYLPQVLNLRDKARFEALGCPVDLARLSAAAAR